MSHFTVLVIGEEPEKQLAPYHEFECTGENDEFVQEVDITEEVRARVAELGVLEGLEYHGLETRRVTNEEDVDRDGAHKYGYVVTKGDEIVKAVDRTNPKAKWDWYLLGGRWTGYFKLKPGTRGKTGKPGIMTDEAPAGRADAARWRDIDWTGMRDDAEKDARERYQEFYGLLGDTPLPKSWERVVKECNNDIERARSVYQAQSGIHKMAKNPKFVGVFVDMGAEFDCTEDEYLERARARAVAPFAIVKGGKWYQRGEMGWWGSVADEKDENVWQTEVKKLLDACPSDTLLSLYDCHI